MMESVSHGLVWLSLALVSALWARSRATRSITQLIGDVEAEPTPGAAMPVRAGITACGAIPFAKGPEAR